MSGQLNLAVVERDGVKGFWFEEHWIRLIENPVNALGRPEPIGFVAADLAKALDQRTGEITRKLDPDQKGVRKMHTPSGDQEMAFVTESGFYDVVIRSNKPQGRRLRRFVTSEILPQVLRTGKYDPALQHQLDPAWQKARLRSRVSRNSYTFAAKQCKAEKSIGAYTNQRYVAITGHNAEGIQRTRFKGDNPPRAKDLLSMVELVANEAMELGVVKQVEQHKAETPDDFRAIDSRVTMLLSTALLGKIDMELPSQAAPRRQSASPYEPFLPEVDF